MGVSALFMSAVTGISQHIDQVEFIVFDNGLGRRDATLNLPDGKAIKLIRFGARGGRRYHRPENIATMLLASRLGALGAKLNQGIRLIDSCDAVLDVSGGDSFSDIYGKGRFNNICRPKAIAINRRKPLILLPQTYGPYKAPEAQQAAVRVIRRASMAWARDKNSYRILQELLGVNFDPAIHRCGVDMAFGMPAVSAESDLDQKTASWLREKSPESPLIGYNISGLIYNDPAKAVPQYGFKADYKRVVIESIERCLRISPARVVLIPHVLDELGHYESDLWACQDVKSKVDRDLAERIVVAPRIFDPRKVKWMIGQVDWFVGTRMHSTIAALSSGVAAAAISYSDKTAGVFDTCNMRDCVIDPRLFDTQAVIDHLLRLYQRRNETAGTLRSTLPQVMRASVDQTVSIAERVKAARSMVRVCR